LAIIRPMRPSANLHEYPMIDQAIYLDHAATTPVRPEVFAAMQPYFAEKFGNPSSIYGLAQEARDGMAEARERVAAVLNCRTGEVVFTGNGTESNNTALKGVSSAMRERGKHIITSSIEHHSVLHPLEQLESEGFEVTVLSVDGGGRIDPAAVTDAVRKDTLIVSVMMANNEIGTVQDLAEISRLTKQRSEELGGQVLVHTDAVQAAGKLSIDTKVLGVDLLSLTGHKIYAPKGVGVLFVRRGVQLEPLMSGGGQERQRRSGTENVPYMVAMGRALELAEAERKEFTAHTGRLRDMLEAGILERLPDTKINGDRNRRVSNITNLSFPGVQGEPVLLGLDFRAIAASSGSACSTASIEPSHVLTALGLSEELAVGSVRFSLGRKSTEAETQEVIAVLPGIVEGLRAM
jgi:cysteine desulfurase